MSEEKELLDLLCAESGDWTLTWRNEHFSLCAVRGPGHGSLARILAVVGPRTLYTFLRSRMCMVLAVVLSLIPRHGRNS